MAKDSGLNATDAEYAADRSNSPDDQKYDHSHDAADSLLYGGNLS